MAALRPDLFTLLEHSHSLLSMFRVELVKPGPLTPGERAEAALYLQEMSPATAGLCALVRRAELRAVEELGQATSEGGAHGPA